MQQVIAQLNNYLAQYISNIDTENELYPIIDSANNFLAKQTCDPLLVINEWMRRWFVQHKTLHSGVFITANNQMSVLCLSPNNLGVITDGGRMYNIFLNDNSVEKSLEDSFKCGIILNFYDGLKVSKNIKVQFKFLSTSIQAEWQRHEPNAIEIL